MKVKLIREEKYEKILQENRQLREERDRLFQENCHLKNDIFMLRKIQSRLQSYIQERPLIGNSSFVKDKE